MAKKLWTLEKSEIEEALLAHADSLSSGTDDGDVLLKHYEKSRQALETLFGLAKRVRDVLPPVDPADVFVTELKTRLDEVRGDQLARRKKWREWRRTVLQIAGITGLIVSGVAMIALGVRFIIGLLSRRRATTAI